MYVPNEKEKENPKYYADNVQKHMAEYVIVYLILGYFRSTYYFLGH